MTGLYPGRGLLRLADEVETALRSGGPVVALESNVITHGLPYPENAETARQAEQAVRLAGAVPATVCVDGGAIKIGMTDDDIERFARGSGIPKVSSRDLPIAVARGGLGATSVAASLVAAELAGIAFFSSAGLGGVHRGAQQSMDISPDLIQLTRSKVATVCAGAKKILDIGLTLEYLETQGVPVISRGCDDFPAFYCVSSGHRSPQRMDDDQLIARALTAHWAMGGGAFLIATPTRPQDAIDGAEIDTAIEHAQAAAARAGVTGPAVTKYLMREVDAVTRGRSAAANAAVLVTCAAVAGQLAAAYAGYRAGTGQPNAAAPGEGAR